MTCKICGDNPNYKHYKICKECFLEFIGEKVSNKLEPSFKYMEYDVPEVRSLSYTRVIEKLVKCPFCGGDIFINYTLDNFACCNQQIKCVMCSRVIFDFFLLNLRRRCSK